MSGFFRNAIVLHVNTDDLPSTDALVPLLRKHALRELGPLEMQTRGWVSPLGSLHDVLLHPVGDFVGLSLATDAKILPGAVIAEAVGVRIAAIVEERGKPPGGKERKRIRDEVLTDLLPRALVRRTRTLAYLDRRDGLLVVDTASKKVAESVATHLRETLGHLVAVPLDPEESAASIMTGWITGAVLPDGVELGDDVDLVDPADTRHTTRVRNGNLDGADVREAMKGGSRVERLGLVVDERVSVFLTESLQLRRLRYLGVIEEELDATDRDSPEAEFDARFALCTLTLRRVIDVVRAACVCAAPKFRRAA